MSATPIRNKAFTLIELLVVIAIIALLVSILLPSISQALHITRQTICATNMRKFAQCAHLYAPDNDYMVPTCDGNGIKFRTFWATSFASIAGGDDLGEEDLDNRDLIEDWVAENDAFRCPGVKAQNLPGGVDYAPNNFDWDRYYRDRVYKSTSSREAAKSIDRMRAAPAEIVYIAECSRRESLNFNDLHKPGHLTYNEHGSPTGQRMIKHDDRRHRGNTTLGFFDGHAEGRKLDDPGNFRMRYFIPEHP
jgi:prepilin-type N-terminal cleavage/methylation domain-containing protein/prepilin-type processing-associated H-X9-DG protein